MAEADRDRAETGIEALIHSILRIVGRRTARSIRAVGSRAIATLDYDEPEGNERRREKVDDSPRVTFGPPILGRKSALIDWF